MHGLLNFITNIQAKINKFTKSSIERFETQIKLVTIHFQLYILYIIDSSFQIFTYMYIFHLFFFIMIR